MENLFAYTGREYDQDTEFYGYRNRYYSPELGRFISMDPIGLNGGDVNLYRYVENRPISFKDPLGLDTCGFSQSSGTFVCMDESGNLSAVDKGYSGKGGGKNNPNMQNIKDTGPLPKGTYSIGPGEYRERTGDFSRRLTPNRMTRKNFPNGRDPYSFLLHGDSRRDPGNASNGCPILSRKARSTPPTGSILNVVE